MATATAFQFPTNGKAYPKAESSQYRYGAYPVSIPYEREGISKAITAIQTIC